MKTPRVTVTHLAVLVAVVALNLAVGRALFAYDVFLFYGLVLMGLALQLGGYRLIRTRGLTRAFWAGFVIVGVGASYSFIWAFKYRGKSPEILLLGWAVWNTWFVYGELADAAIWWLSQNVSLQTVKHALLSGVADSVAAFIPQLVLALAGGFMFLRIAKWCGVRLVPVPPAPGDGPAASVPSRVD